MESFFKRFSAFVLLLLIVSIGATAQNLNGSISGQATDPSGAVVPGASVTATDLGTSTTYRATTGSDGEFVIGGLPYGFYRVRVEAKGFSAFVIENVQVLVSQISRVNTKLQVSTATTEVVVTAEQAAVQTESVEIKNSIDMTMIRNLPLGTRNPLDLVRTMAGAVAPSSSGIGDVFVHGLRGNSTNIIQDGVNVADNFVKTSSFFAIVPTNVDNVGEFSVSTSGSGTDAGFGATQVNIVTNRGTNNLHGSVYWFQRTSFLNANNFFNRASGIPTPFQLQNRIGYAVGGPIFAPKLYNGKNKTFFFNSFEAFRDPVARSRTRLVMSDTARTGQFTYTRLDNGQSNTVNLLALGQIGNTGATPAINRSVVDYYNSLVPSPNTDAGCSGGDAVNLRCFAFNLPGKNKTNSYTARLDHYLTPNHSIEFVYRQSNFDSSPDLLNGIEPFFPKSPGGGQQSKRQLFTWAFHSVFGGNKTNTARFGLQRAPVTFVVNQDFSPTGGAQLLFARVQSPRITSTNLPQGRNTPVRQASDNFGWVKGKHNMQFGGEYRVILANSFFFNTIPQRVVLGSNSSNPNGITASKFPGGINTTALGIAGDIFNNITGLLSSVSLGFNHTSPTSGFVGGKPRTVDPWQNNWAFYGQDSWRLRPNLTIQAGLRWEYQGPFDLRNKLIIEPDDRLAAIWAAAGVGNQFNVLATSPASDVLLPFAGGRNGKRLYDRDLNNFAPFAGFAWDPFKNGKTAVRAGFAMHYTQDGFTLFQNAATGQTGLFTVATNAIPTGNFTSSSIPTPPAPTDVIPVSQKANFAATGGGANLWSFKKDLATPYVLDWNFAIQRELPGRFTAEVRYVGNRAVKLYRSTDYNELNLRNNPYTAFGASVPNVLTEFNNARNNLAICTNNRVACTGSAAGAPRFDNRGLPGQLPLPILQTLFQGLSLGSGFTNSSFVTFLNENRIGSMFDSLRRSPTFAANRANFPLNFFVPNPFASSSILVDNASWSQYNGLEAEVRRRFTGGLFLIGNYTFSKVLTDARFLTNQSEFQSFRSVADRTLDRNRAAFDVRHSVNVTYVYPLPIGRGQWLGRDAGMALNALIGGWSVQGQSGWSSGAPFEISSGRFTTGVGPVNGTAETAVLRNISKNDLRKQFGTFKTPNGVFWLNPNSGLLKISGNSSTPVLCTPGQTTPCFDFPGAGEFGNLSYLEFDGPAIFQQNLSVIKQIRPLRDNEKFNFEIRLEGFNLFNHPNFQTPESPGTQSLLSPSFGQLTSLVDVGRSTGVLSRTVQWAVKVNF